MIENAILDLVRKAYDENDKQKRKMEIAVKNKKEYVLSEEKQKEIEMRDTDIMRLIGLFMCVTLFFTQKDASSLNEKYIGLVHDTDRSKNLSWLDLIHHHLREQLFNNSSNPTVVTGCVIYLLVSTPMILYFSDNVDMDWIQILNQSCSCFNHGMLSILIVLNH